MSFDSFLSVLLTPWCLGVLGLCVGSFLNVVIHPPATKCLSSNGAQKEPRPWAWPHPRKTNNPDPVQTRFALPAMRPRHSLV